ncbi:MAG: hypothetical protein ACFHX7_13750 [Pseudomonadota bacterium]
MIELSTRHRSTGYTWLLAIAAVLCLPGPASAGEAKPTATGRPDLSGTYDTATLTPLSRPARYGDRLTVSAEEAAAIEQYWRENLARDDMPSDPNRDAPPEGGVEVYVREFSGAAGKVGGYNSFFVDLGENVTVINGEYRTSIITKPDNGRMPQFTRAALNRLKAQRAFYHENTGTAWWIEMPAGPYDNPESRPVAERCLLGFGSTSGPPMLPVMYNNMKRIVQTDEYVMILVEMNHDARIIRMDDHHLPDGVKRWMGDSIGRWEGDTLVVETANFRADSVYSVGTENMKVTERFSRLDADTLLYQFTVTDPDTWQAPWSGEYTWRATTDRVFEYACHEGNYALGGILRGARLLEREALGQAVISSGEE